MKNNPVVRWVIAWHRGGSGNSTVVKGPQALSDQGGAKRRGEAGVTGSRGYKTGVVDVSGKITKNVGGGGGGGVSNHLKSGRSA